MINLVVDSSVVIKWFLLEVYSAQARAIRAGAQSGALTLLAPDLIYAELGNIVWKKQTLQGLAATDAQRIIDAVQVLPLSATPAAVLLDDAYRIAVAHGRTVYDALYVALGLRESCPFVTADQRLVNSVAATFPHVVLLGAWSPPAGSGDLIPS
jgi:predicted nucleic acid-binding protein